MKLKYEYFFRLKLQLEITFLNGLCDLLDVLDRLETDGDGLQVGHSTLLLVYIGTLCRAILTKKFKNSIKNVNKLDTKQYLEKNLSL